MFVRYAHVIKCYVSSCLGAAHFNIKAFSAFLWSWPSNPDEPWCVLYLKSRQEPLQFIRSALQTHLQKTWLTEVNVWSPLWRNPTFLHLWSLKSRCCWHFHRCEHQSACERDVTEKPRGCCERIVHRSKVWRIITISPYHTPPFTVSPPNMEEVLKEKKKIEKPLSRPLGPHSC